MKITVITVGKLKEKYLKEGILEYTKRLSRFTKLDIVELPDEKTPDSASLAENQAILDKEGQKILQKIADRSFVIALAIEGKLMSSEELSQTMADVTIRGFSEITFIIGGSLGLSPAVKQRSNMLLSFGKITLPHQLMRLVLIEQIYRSFMIQQGSPYHK
ncbi:23S rRNA (pseudouridine(1915)-N(3))-methyltransferase RlmH [Streptococcus fryi]